MRRREYHDDEKHSGEHPHQKPLDFREQSFQHNLPRDSLNILPKTSKYAGRGAVLREN